MADYRTRSGRPTARTARSRFSIHGRRRGSDYASLSPTPNTIGNANGVHGDRGAAAAGAGAATSAEDGSVASSSGTSTTTVTLTLMPKHRSPSLTPSSPSPKSTKKSRFHHGHAADGGHHHLRERWLLTRKTWRYMADAGRKLIPDGATSLGRHKNKPDARRLADELTRLEEHFQHVCRTEPKFLPWRRKASYPGALTSLRRRKRGGRAGGNGSSGASSMSPTSPPKASSADEADDEAGRDDGQRLMMMIRMLEKYLNIQAEDEQAADGGEQLEAEGDASGDPLTGSLFYDNTDEIDRTTDDRKRTTDNRTPLILSQTNEQLKQNWLAQPYDGRPNPSSIAFRPSTTSSASSSKGGSSVTSPTLLTTAASQTQAFFQSDSASGPSATKERNPDWAASMHTSLLLDNLRHYSRSNRNPLLSYDRITSDVLTDKRLLRQIRDELKQQQLQRILNRHSSRTSTSSSALNIFPTAGLQHRNYSRSITTASSTSSSSIFSFWQRDPRDPTTASSIHLRHVSDDQPDHPNQSTGHDRYATTSGHSSRVHFQRRYATAGTQTDPIPIKHLQQLHVDFRKRVETEAAEAAAAAAAAAAEEAANAPPATPPPGGAKHSRRKSSIDNEDVSQSVSDTIKRYLRMARKKSVHESDANRFKRVNYDQTLRNIKPKGEITLIGDDDGTSKGAQTDTDWIVRVMIEIRALGRELGVLPGSATGGEDEDALPRATNIHSIMGMRPTQRPPAQEPPPARPSKHSAHAHQAPSSPPGGGGGLFHSSTQFLSNLLPWHSDKQQHPAVTSSPTQSLTQSPPLTNTSHSHQPPTPTHLTNSPSPPPSNPLHLSTQSLSLSVSSSSACPPPAAGAVLPSDVGPVDTSNSSSSSSTMQPPTLLAQQLQSVVTATAAVATAHNQSTTTANASSAAAAAAAITKSKSSSNVSQTFAKKIWKSRSKSQSRTASPSDAGRFGGADDGGFGGAGDAEDRLKSEWLPQGNGVWTTVSGDQLQLQDTRLFELSEPERLSLHRVAVDRIGQLNIGVNVTPPDGNPAVAPTPKKRHPLLLKRKALTTSFFDTTKSKDDTKSCSGGLAFGIPLQKVVDNDRMLRHRRGGSHHGSTSSLCDGLGGHVVGSCESLLAHGIVRGGHRLSQTRPSLPDDLQVPQIVRACCSHLLENGMSTVGIFRVGTIKRRVEQLREDFDRGDCTVFEPDVGPHDVAFLLKDFLRSMPEPLLCRSLYMAFLQTQKIRNRRLQLEAMSHLIQLLPVAHRDTLYTLLRFLAEVARHSEDSTAICRETGARIPVAGHRMDASNLATVMSPNILHDTLPGQAATEAEVSDRLDVINVVRTMIDHYDELFVVPVDILDDVYAQLMDSDPRQLDELCDAYRSRMSADAAGSRSDGHGMSVFSPMPDAHVRAPDYGPVDPPTAPRRMYVRQDFMHQNTVRAENNGSGSGSGTVVGGSAGAGFSSSTSGSTTIKRRERTSKMRYQEPENEMAGQRRRRPVTSGRSSSATGTPTPDASASKPFQMSMIGSTATTTTSTLKSHSASSTHSTSDSSNRGGGPRSSSIDTTSHATPSGIVPSASPKLSQDHRRLSTPFVQHGSGVMSASLQLPVQPGSLYHQQPTSSLNLGADDLAEIPYIEDGSGSSGNSGVNVGGITYLPTPTAETAPTPVVRTGSLKRGSLLIGSAASAVAAAAAQRIRGVTGGSSPSSSPTPASVQQRRTVDPPNSITIASLSLGGSQHQSDAFGGTSSSAPTTPARHTPEKTRVEKSSSGSSLLKAAVGLSKKSFGLSSSSKTTTVVASTSTQPSAQPPRVEPTEPRVSTSISTIGSEVLRSKTADFERLLVASGSSARGRGSNGAEGGSDTGRSASSQSQTQQRAGPIYKRQELISSRQTSKK